MLLGVLAIAVSRAGAQERPAFAALVVLLGLAAAAFPAAYGLPIAVVLACFEGFLHDFVGPRALYWNEAFTAGVVARSLLARRPTRAEAIGVAAVAVVFAGYLVTGTSLKASAWGLKVLLTSAVVAWALARTHAIGRREWRNVYLTLAAVTLGSVILAAWQRAHDVAGLQQLGLVYGQRIREVGGGGTVRVFAGFTSAAPFSYALAIALCAWCAYAFGSSEDRREALRTAWLPTFVVIGILLTVDRTAVLALVAAFGALALGYRRRLALPFVVLAVLAVASVATFRGTDAVDSGIGPTLRARAALWQEYLADLRPFGRGPATAGSAYDKVAPPGWHEPLRVPSNWTIGFDRVDLPRASEPVLEPGVRAGRPTLHARARAVSFARRLTVREARRGGKRIYRLVVPAARAVPLVLPLHLAPSREVRLSVVAAPAPTRAARPGYGGTIVNLIANPSLERNLTGWFVYQSSGTGARMERTTDSAAVGAASLKVIDAQGVLGGDQGAAFNAFPIVATEPYTASVYLRGERGGEAVSFLIGDSKRPAVATRGTAFRLSRAWRRFEFTFTRPRSDRGGIVLVQSGGVATGGEIQGRQTFYVDGLQVERSPRATAYCDGSVVHCRWAGRPNFAPSARAGATALEAPLTGAPAFAVQTALVASTARPMPQRTPFRATLGGERVDVLAIAGPGEYRIRRSARPAPQPRGELLWASFARGSPAVVPRDRAGTAITLEGFRIDGLPPPRTPAERVWNRWLDATPAALEGDGPGLVDSLYVSWLWQYGLLGAFICAAWLAIALLPAFVRKRDTATVTATLVGVFLVVAGLAVSVWEESPTDLLAALVFAYAFGKRDFAARGRSGNVGAG